MSPTEIRELASSEVTTVSGGSVQEFLLGGGFKWVFGFSDNGKLNSLYLCTAKNCEDVLAH